MRKVLVLILLGFACRSEGKQEVTPRFNHVMLYVSDIDSSITFYEEVFGMELYQTLDQLVIEQNGGVDTVAVNMAFLRLPHRKFILELSQQSVPDSIQRSPHYQHLGISVADIEASHQKVVGMGVRVLAPIRTITAGDLKVKNSFYSGPDGETIELMQMLEGDF